ncbi:LIM homeobox transcription factor 1-beta isoform X2 [Toxorhynchites rutilus septentrionalis]|uniref:LIM homeobox transcription factor 1-beta isoform X2 n=1 Tax=Toxorhynchites rutilus septentrionalis TaxID=329112 RepID=UPI00247A7B91|nr:LIM homeobox transcription factor 1-beta isoform X2 [Toxorhynchites rutilus septentrionalis]
MLEFYHNLNLNTGITQGQTADSKLQDNPLNGNEQTDIVGTIKSEKSQEICEGCGQKIKDRYFMKLSPDQYWHEQCLLCCICHIQLNQSCFTKNTKVYCKEDYYRMYGLSPLQQQQQQSVCRDCYGCGERISPNEMVMRAKNLVYHLNCFLCYTCNRPLQKGEPFSMRAGKLICQHDLEKDMYSNMHSLHSHQSPHLYGDDDYLLEDGIRSRDGRRGPKRPRTILTSAQRRQFKASFDVSPKPCRKVREALAKDTGLSVRVVQVWFQNQRAKMKKISRKSKTAQNGNTDGEKTHSDKDEKSIKLESPQSDHGHYLNVDGSYGSSSQPLNPNIPYSPDFPENSDASMCSSDISLDESFDNFDEGASDSMSLQNLDLQTNLNSSGSSNNSANNNTDKLYLMQNSYFNSTVIEQ